MTSTNPPTPPILTGRDIGAAQKATGALLDRQLARVGLPFEEWTVLFTLNGTGPLPASELVGRQVDGLKITDAAARAVVDGMRAAGRLGPIDDADADDPRLAPTADAEAVFRPVFQAVTALTAELYGDLPPADLEATRRTLAEVTRRANARLAALSG
jgi:DNA-binding MarR family transcriptional regulator